MHKVIFKRQKSRTMDWIQVTAQWMRVWGRHDTRDWLPGEEESLVRGMHILPMPSTGCVPALLPDPKGEKAWLAWEGSWWGGIPTGNPWGTTMLEAAKSRHHHHQSVSEQPSVHTETKAQTNNNSQCKHIVSVQYSLHLTLHTGGRKDSNCNF